MTGFIVSDPIKYSRILFGMIQSEPVQVQVQVKVQVYLKTFRLQ